MTIIIGEGEVILGETIIGWGYEKYYPWGIVLVSVVVLIGLATLYVSGQEGLSAKSFGMK